MYETKDGKHVAIGSIEKRFYGELLRAPGSSGEDLPAQRDKARWPELRARLTEVFQQKTRDEWCAVMEGSDVCFAPVLSMAEAPRHPHNAAREHVRRGRRRASSPRPRRASRRSKPSIQRPPARRGEHTDAALADWGFAPATRSRRSARAGAIA